jgi:hypothetical protein
MAKYTKETALSKAQEMIDQKESRSHVCSFLNDLASSKLIGERTADRLADTLSADRSNAAPVLRSIIEILER